MFKNIEDDLSSIHQLEKGEYLITDPRLLHGMTLKEHIRSGKVNILTRGTVLDASKINRLQDMGIETVFAKHQVAESIEEAADEMEEVFDLLQKSIFTAEVNSAMDAVEVLKKEGRINAKDFSSELSDIVSKIVNGFSPYAAEGIRDLEKHSQNTTLHSVEVALMAVELAQAMDWGNDLVSLTGLAGMLHDVGKAGVPEEILNHPGHYNDEQWRAMESHALIGYLILTNNEAFHDVPAYAAGMHHERFSGTGRSYGLLKFHKDITVDLDSTYGRQDNLIAQTIAICDVYSALGETRDYKSRKFPLELLMVMNLEAKHGKFNPALFRNWYRIYREKTPNLLQKGYCFSLPTTKRRLLARRPIDRIVLPISEIRFTFKELTKMGLVPKLLDADIRISEVQRRGGLTLHELNARGIKDIPENLEQMGIEPEKSIDYDIVAIDIDEPAKAKFLIKKSTDSLTDLQLATKEGRLDPAQTICLGSRNIEIDFTHDIKCPV